VTSCPPKRSANVRRRAGSHHALIRGARWARRDRARSGPVRSSRRRCEQDGRLARPGRAAANSRARQRCFGLAVRSAPAGCRFSARRARGNRRGGGPRARLGCDQPQPPGLPRLDFIAGKNACAESHIRRKRSLMQPVVEMPSPTDDPREGIDHPKAIAGGQAISSRQLLVPRSSAA